MIFDAVSVSPVCTSHSHPHGIHECRSIIILGQLCPLTELRKCTAYSGSCPAFRHGREGKSCLCMNQHAIQSNLPPFRRRNGDRYSRGSMTQLLERTTARHIHRILESPSFYSTRHSCIKPCTQYSVLYLNCQGQFQKEYPIRIRRLPEKVRSREAFRQLSATTLAYWH